MVIFWLYRCLAKNNAATGFLPLAAFADRHVRTFLHLRENTCFYLLYFYHDILENISKKCYSIKKENKCFVGVGRV